MQTYNFFEMINVLTKYKYAIQINFVVNKKILEIAL